MVAGSRAASPCRRWSKGTEPTTVSERAVPSCYLLESVQRLAERQEPLDPLLGPNSNSHASCAAELSIGLLKPSSPAARIKIPCGAGQDELTNSLARRCKGGRIHVAHSPSSSAVVSGPRRRFRNTVGAQCGRLYPFRTLMLRPFTSGKRRHRPSIM
jgi:hypothetical protein